MTTSALILMVTVWSIVTFATLYFFWKVLKTPVKPADVTDSSVIDDLK